MVPYYCEKQGIELPDRVVVPRVLENPPFRPSRTMFRDISLQSYPLQHQQQTTQNLDVSQVKTVAFNSSQITNSHTPPPVRTVIDRPSFASSNIFQPQPQVVRQVQQSPKITFNIRGSLPAQLAQSGPITPVSPIKTLPRSNENVSRQGTQVVFTKGPEMISPQHPQQKVVMQRV